MKSIVILIYKFSVLTSFLVIISERVIAQNHNTEFWGAYINTTSITKNWKIWNDFHYVDNAFGLIRSGITYQTKSDYQFTAGYAYVKAATEKTNRLVRSENRLWGQAIKKFSFNEKFEYIVRFRYDARSRQSLNQNDEVIPDEKIFYHRFRLMQDLRFSLSQNTKEKYWHMDLINETLLNTGKQIENGLDQTRSYLLAGFTHPNFTLLAGYHQRLTPSNSNNWTFNHGFTVWLIHSINLTQ